MPIAHISTASAAQAQAQTQSADVAQMLHQLQSQVRCAPAPPAVPVCAPAYGSATTTTTTTTSSTSTTIGGPTQIHSVHHAADGSVTATTVAAAPGVPVQQFTYGQGGGYGAHQQQAPWNAGYGVDSDGEDDDDAQSDRFSNDGRDDDDRFDRDSIDGGDDHACCPTNGDRDDGFNAPWVNNGNDNDGGHAYAGHAHGSSSTWTVPPRDQGNNDGDDGTGGWSFTIHATPNQQAPQQHRPHDNDVFTHGIGDDAFVSAGAVPVGVPVPGIATPAYGRGDDDNDAFEIDDDAVFQVVGSGGDGFGGEGHMFTVQVGGGDDDGIVEAVNGFSLA
ncbi:hypothetical protein H9P43_006847 [Blastocladiella emersonii ATCC 22665]|nr:hypothetical protein H9P43_006847 [Blastocladiella emersonii ATCC 22665]